MEYKGNLYGKVGGKYIKLEETTGHIDTIKNEVERCYTEISDKESIIATMGKIEVGDVVYFNDKEGFYEVTSEYEDRIDCSTWDDELCNVRKTDVDQLYKKAFQSGN